MIRLKEIKPRASHLQLQHLAYVLFSSLGAVALCFFIFWQELQERNHLLETLSEEAHLKSEQLNGLAKELESQAEIAEAASAEVRRNRDLMLMRDAEVLAEQGEVELALQKVLTASDSFVSISDVPDDVLISFERVLETAAREKHFVLGQSEVVSFGSDRAIFTSHQWTGADLLRFGSDRETYAPHSMLFEYLIYVERGATAEDDVLFWDSAERLVIERGRRNVSNTVRRIASVPNTVSQTSFPEWEIVTLKGGRHLVLQWLSRSAELEIPHWDHSQNRDAHVVDIAAGTVTHVSSELGEDENIDLLPQESLVQHLEGRQPLPTPRTREHRDLDLTDLWTWQCAGDGPKSRRFRQARAILEAIRQNALTTAVSAYDCIWSGNSVVAVTTNYASSVYRVAHFLRLDSRSDVDGNLDVIQADHLGEVQLASGEIAGYRVKDHVDVYDDGSGNPAFVAAKGRDVFIFHKLRIERQRMPRSVTRVVALESGRVAAFLASNRKASGHVDRRMTLIDVSRTFSEMLESLPILNSLDSVEEYSEPRADSNRVCFSIADLEPASYESGLYKIKLPTGNYFPGLIPEWIVARLDPQCVYPFTALPAYSVFVDNSEFVIQNNGLIVEETPITSVISGGTTPDAADPSFYVTAQSVIRRKSDVIHKVYSTTNRILAVDVSPSGNRMLLATSDGSPSVHLYVWSIDAGRLWRDLGYQHRWFEIDFQRENLPSAGIAGHPTGHRLLDLGESRRLAKHLLEQNF